jgi:hypothetical protein
MAIFYSYLKDALGRTEQPRKAKKRKADSLRRAEGEDGSVETQEE